AYDICTDHRGVYVGGETTDANWDSWDGFVRGYDTAGAPLWTYEIGSDDGWEWISGVEISNRGFFFCGETSGSMPGCVNLGDSDCFAGMMLSDADISASPISYDYGDVTVWDSPMTLITVVNNGMEALVIDELYFEQGDTDYFTFPYYYDLPVYVMGGQVRYVAVSYHPWEEGSHSTYL
ncbi:hypothetical protein GWN63_00535, partial [Candidatus Bathyarchaeota archaeon]|nr:hypothetical protein [Desulfobacterales bacterium]NIU80728.1 hypothetical protein [Candidatus Bathyarchaeota archaeon]NIV68325.1 hypothetical protein [Candidatus Bathyarchaeota archaeon]